MGLPNIKYDPHKLINFYYSSCHVTKTEISNGLGCCHSSAKKIFDATKKELKNRGTPPYHPNKVDRKVIFQLYGWDIKDIEKSVSVLNKLKGA